jgi:hypothetical protein
MMMKKKWRRMNFRTTNTGSQQATSGVVRASWRQSEQSLERRLY